MTFPTADTLTINTNWNVTAPRRPVRQLRVFMIMYNS